MKTVTEQDFDNLIEDPLFSQLTEKKFNVFSTLAIQKNELVHSRTIGWLLDPQGTHQLGSAFLQEFVKEILKQENKKKTFSVTNQTRIYLESNNIDILALDKDFCLVIENKTKTGEHDEQLQRYKAIADKYNRKHKELVYLTPPWYGTPTDKDYTHITYKSIYQMLKKLQPKLTDKQAHMFIKQYMRTVKEDIMQEGEINKKCEELYAKHTKAIDILVNHLPSAQNKLRKATANAVEKFVASKDSIFKMGPCSNTINRFSTPILNKKELQKGEGWPQTKNLLLWEVTTTQDGSINLELVLGKGPKELRETLYAGVTAKKNREKNQFIPERQRLNHWPRIWQCQLATYENSTIIQKTSSELENEILTQLQQHKPDIDFMDTLLDEFRSR